MMDVKALCLSGWCWVKMIMEGEAGRWDSVIYVVLEGQRRWMYKEGRRYIEEREMDGGWRRGSGPPSRTRSRRHT
jgi:hypothetical protein